MTTTCGYTGSHFGAHYDDAQCCEGYLWDLDSGGVDDAGNTYLDHGGDLPCPQCNQRAYISHLADEWQECGYNSADHIYQHRQFHRLGRHYPARIRRALKRHFARGRREALRDARTAGHFAD